jgi:hypothetical protein
MAGGDGIAGGDGSSIVASPPVVVVVSVSLLESSPPHAVTNAPAARPVARANRAERDLSRGIVTAGLTPPRAG